MNNLEQEVAVLSRELGKLNDHQVMRSHATWGRLLLFNFLRGLAFGFGSVVGATVLVAALVYTLSWVDFIPVVGEWAAEIVRIVEGAR